jgi:GT2 family glycosyltransferase
MSVNDLVSCIVLTYKKFNDFYETIDSILEQDYPNIEIIIGDDCSPNFEENKIREYIKSRANKNISNLIIIHHEKNIGTVKNFNRAIESSKGKYIFPLSSDDLYFNKDTVSNIVKYFQTNNCLIATAYREVYSEDLNTFIERLPPSYLSKHFNENPINLYKKLCFGNFISGACTYYTKELFDKYGLFDESYLLLEDYPKYLSVTRSGVKIGFMDFSTIKYRYGGISTQSVPNPIIQKELKKSIDNEILNHKKLFNIFLYRRIKFYVPLKFNKLTSFELFIHKIKFLDVQTYNFLSSKKNIIISFFKKFKT